MMINIADMTEFFNLQDNLTGSQFLRFRRTFVDYLIANQPEAAQKLIDDVLEGDLSRLSPNKQ